MKPQCEVADMLQGNMHRLNSIVPNGWKLRTLYALSACRTPILGGHIDKCENTDCNTLHISYNSCRNRHCPKCQGHKREEWIEKREQELLKVPYYHVVFTIPAEFNELALYKPELVYSTLFKVAWSVIRDFGLNAKFLGAKTGMISILHTWGQNLSLHPHLHCIVPGGGITMDNKWKNAVKKDKYLFPVKAMSKVFRARFIESIRKEYILPQQLAKAVMSKEWVIYCKQPFWGASQVIEYLGRYTHKIAISNHRIKSITDNDVYFVAKDYRKGGKKSVITLSHYEFIRRFALHILPKGFVRIRHYGILSSAIKKRVRESVELQIGKVELKAPKPKLHRKCKVCKTGNLVTILAFDGRGPPDNVASYGSIISMF